MARKKTPEAVDGLTDIPHIVIRADEQFGMLAIRALYRESEWSAWSPEQQKLIAAKMREFEMFNEAAD